MTGRSPRSVYPRGAELRARLALALESLWPLAAPLVGIAALFVALAATDLLPALPGWLHAILLAAFVAAFAWFLWRLRAWRLPDQTAARRRIEAASGFAHRPLLALEDSLASGDEALWQAHRRRLLARLGRIRSGWPGLDLTDRDPFAVRAALVLFLVVALIGAGADLPARLRNAAWPSFGPPKPPPTLDAWITPPGYTGLPPIFLAALPADKVIDVPAGSKLYAQVSGASTPPALVIDKKSQPLTQSEAQGPFRIETPLTEGGALAIRLGQGDLGAWPIRVVADQRPVVEFAKPPAGTPRQALRVDWKATDDYGIETVAATIRRSEEAVDAALKSDPIELAMTIGAKRKDATGAGIFDLTAHIWAGLPVQIQLRAKDAAGQEGASEWVATTLPERNFRNPVARRIAQLRRQFILAPAEFEEIRNGIADLMGRPQMFGHDTLVFLGLSSARARLMLEDYKTAADPVQKLMWDLAIRVEEGDAGNRERELRAAEQALRDAIANNAPDPEIERLVADMQRALDRYLESMMQQAQQNPRQSRPLDPNARTITRNEMQRMLDKARELARMGQKEAAQALLDQLRQIMENLQTAQSSEEQMDGEDPMQQAMQGLQELARRQRDLMDRSMRAGQQRGQQQRGQQQRGQQGRQGQQGEQGEPGDQPGDSPGDLAAAQAELRRMLGELAQRMGEQGGNVPGSLGRAERAMRQSGDALERGAPGQSVGPQGDALEQLREAARDIARQMQEQAGQGQGQEMGRNNQSRPGEPRDARDPFGRAPNQGTASDSGDVVVPSDNQVRRARDIFEELRRRRVEPDRPAIERDYIDRLLRQF